MKLFLDSKVHYKREFGISGFVIKGFLCMRTYLKHLCKVSIKLLDEGYNDDVVLFLRNIDWFAASTVKSQNNDMYVWKVQEDH